LYYCGLNEDSDDTGHWFFTRCLAAVEERFRTGVWNHSDLQRSQFLRSQISSVVGWLINDALEMIRTAAAVA